MLVLDKPAGMAVHGGSGVSKGVIDKIDPSYLRKGRVNEYYNMVTPLVEA